MSTQIQGRHDGECWECAWKRRGKDSGMRIYIEGERRKNELGELGFSAFEQRG
jgi:hypothetical protein